MTGEARGRGFVHVVLRFRTAARLLVGGLRRRRRPKRRVQQSVGRLAFFIPALFLLIFLVIFPVLQTVFLGFFTSGPNRSLEFVGGDNYADVINDKDTVNVEELPWPPPLGTLFHNALWIAIHLPISLLAGLWLALLFRNVKGSSILKSFIFLGMVTPMIVGGIILKFLLEGGLGIVPSFFGLIGVDALHVNWLARRELLLLGLIFGSIWLWTGFSVVVYSAGLTTIPNDYFEAARVDGTPAFRMFFRVTLPLLRPITLVVIVMTLLWELKIFDVVFAATNPDGGPLGAADVLALQMWRYGFVQRDVGRATVVASILSLTTLAATLAIVRRMVKG